MTIPPPLVPAPPEERMSRRARRYMLIAAFRHGVVGLACVLDPAQFESGSYQGIKDALPLRDDLAIVAWGVVFLITAGNAIVSAAIARAGIARVALLFSVISTMGWVGGFLAAMLSGDATGPTGWVAWSALALKDFTMLGDPMRTPFEDRIREVAARHTGR